MYFPFVIMITFSTIQLIFTLMFYRLEKFQLNQMELKPLIKSKGIYYELILISWINIVFAFLIWSLIASIFDFPTFSEGSLIHILIMVSANIAVFFVVNYFTFKQFNAFYFCTNKIIRIKYNLLFQLKEKEIIEIDNLQYLKTYYFRQGIILQASTKNNDGLDRYFNGYHLNIKKIEKFCSEKNIQFENSKVSLGEFRALKKYID